jgi:lipoprotein NlpI
LAQQLPQRSWQRIWCEGIESNTDQRITGCTALIQSGGSNQGELAAEHFFRGFAYAGKADYDRAIADYSEAIRLNNHLLSYSYRGDAYYAEQQYDRAIADYTAAFALDSQNPAPLIFRGNVRADRTDYGGAILDDSKAIEIDPKFGGAYFGRGLAHLYAGSLSAARADFERATELEPQNALAALWLEIVDKRGNLPSRLAVAAKQIDMRKWPGPVVRLFLGSLNPETILAAADNRNSNIKRGRTCQADFYRGEFALLNGSKDKATQLFQAAATGCPISRAYPEQWVAKAELKGFGVLP